MTTTASKLLSADAGLAAMLAISSAQLLEGSYLPDWSEEEGCPLHGGEVKKSYTFGMQDAEVYVFTNCKCAVCRNCYSAVLGPSETDTTYHKSYAQAAGRARLIKAKAALPLA